MLELLRVQGFVEMNKAINDTLEDGLVRFYDDIYGHDAALQKILDKGYPYPW